LVVFGGGASWEGSPAQLAVPINSAIASPPRIVRFSAFMPNSYFPICGIPDLV
jgi:hypothetical protein